MDDFNFDFNLCAMTKIINKKLWSTSSLSMLTNTLEDFGDRDVEAGFSTLLVHSRPHPAVEDDLVRPTH